MKLNTTKLQDANLKLYRLDYLYKSLAEISQHDDFKEFLKSSDVYEYYKLRENCYLSVTCNTYALQEVLKVYKVAKRNPMDRHAVFYFLCKFFLKLDSYTKQKIHLKVVQDEHIYSEFLSDY